jgi:hypothetical protein
VHFTGEQMMIMIIKVEGLQNDEVEEDSPQQQQSKLFDLESFF